MTAHEARELLLAGERIRMVVGTAEQDPTLVLWRDENVIVSEAIAGWSADVVEIVCRVDTESEFLLEHLSGRAHLYRHDVEQGEK